MKKKQNQKYLLSWMALGLMVLSSSCLLVLSSISLKPDKLKFIFSIASWMAILAPGIYLFLRSSNRSLELLRDDNTPNEDLGADRKLKNNPSQRKQDQLDIQGIAKKIVRRVSPDENPEKWGLQLLKQLVAEIEIMSGIFYLRNEKGIFKSAATYAYPLSTEPFSFTEGEGITGQVAKNKQVVIYRSIPEDYKEVFSGLGIGKPSYLALVPILIDDVAVAIIEMAGFKWSGEKLEQLFQIIARDLSEKMQDINNG